MDRLPRYQSPRCLWWDKTQLKPTLGPVSPSTQLLQGPITTHVTAIRLSVSKIWNKPKVLFVTSTLSSLLAQWREPGTVQPSLRSPWQELTLQLLFFPAVKTRRRKLWSRSRRKSSPQGFSGSRGLRFVPLKSSAAKAPG